ncbi:MAG TPA: glycoside hydrolase family 18 protein [Chryseolinea sp.]|nr:glycoside hydrolase family 18 protein [Chryseolinea sp.]HPM32766.1 glycoside hydrolase family 18 protein [Chryseolinea sp.]
MFKKQFLLFLFVLNAPLIFAQNQKSINIIAYYSAGPEKVASIQAEKLTHIIFSFCHLKGNRLQVDSPRDSITIKNLVDLKKRNPNLKVILSLGGWGGCETCSPVFSSATGRDEFSKSVLELNQYFKTDGIDLDWEYPTIEGHPGHPYSVNDKPNFTELINSLRNTLGKNYEISFAAGGFQHFLEESVDWKAIIDKVDRVNLMTYDLVSGFSIQTGHHTPLYSRPGQNESTDNAVNYLIKSGIPADKLVIGAAFYGRMWEKVPNINNGLYQSGKFKSFIDYSKLGELTKEKGFTIYWDETAKAPYLYNEKERLFVTYDNIQSMKLKTSYAIDHQLDGIMFWELSIDAAKDGLLDAIYSVAEKSK